MLAAAVDALLTDAHSCVSEECARSERHATIAIECAWWRNPVSRQRNVQIWLRTTLTLGTVTALAEYLALSSEDGTQ